MDKILVVKNRSGLHARPCGMIARSADKFKSEIIIEAKGKRVNSKSIMSLMSLGVKEGEEVKIIVEGSDEINAFNEIAGLFESGFGEI